MRDPFEKGNPLSLAKAQTSLEQVASVVIFPEKIRRKTTTLSSNATPVFASIVEKHEIQCDIIESVVEIPDAKEHGY